MKKVFKWGFIILIAIVVIAVFAGGGEDTTTTTDSKTTDTKVEEKKTSVTKENYEKIKQGESLTGKGGMTVEEVTAILGEPSDKMESSYDDGNGNTVKTLDYTWMTSDFESISITFTNGHVSHKMWMD